MEFFRQRNNTGNVADQVSCGRLHKFVMLAVLPLLSLIQSQTTLAMNIYSIQGELNHVSSIRLTEDDEDQMWQANGGQLALAPDRAGLISDTKYFFLYQIVFVGILYVAPESISGWSDESKDKDRCQSYKDNVSDVVWDEDDWAINYIGHPYFGAAYYIRARERGYDRQASFWYSAALSASYEFGIEALFESPSIQDLIATPVLGAALGYYFEKVRANVRHRKMQTGTLSTSDKFLLGFTDPLGFLNQYADKWFKSDVDVTIAPYIGRAPYKSREFNNNASSSIGLMLNIKW